MKAKRRPAFGILLSICLCHLNNDMLQSLLAAVYPTLKIELNLNFSQIGFITLAYQLTASLLQPVIGLYGDRYPAPFSLPLGTLFTFTGLLMLSASKGYAALVAGACVLGVGSSVFHPEATRVARMASAGRPGLAQSLFQVGGNAGSALGPVGAAVIVSRWGRHSIGAFSAVALVSTAILGFVGLWYKRHGLARLADEGGRVSATGHAGVALDLPCSRVRTSIAVLMTLIFSKFVYLASFTSYYTFYLMHHFHVSLGSAQMHLFALLAAVAAGTVVGGPLGDRFGRKHVITFSMLGVLPFTLALPYADLPWTGALSIVIGFILASAFPTIVVYGQELVPGRVGVVAGLFFGLSFGAAGLGAALLGRLADATSIEQVYRVVAFLPALGLLSPLLPSFGKEPAPS